MDRCRSPLGRLVLLTLYYFAIIVGLILLYGKGQLTPTEFIYQGF
jgi:hypothetical protein